jgi:hypothetical protein
MGNISRRKLLLAAGAVGLGASVLLKAFIERDKRALQELGRLLKTNAYAKVLAEEVLKAIPLTIDALEAELTSRVAFVRERAPGMLSAELLAHLLREDFDQGRTLDIGGWLVSDSEAKAYAYLGLSQIAT